MAPTPFRTALPWRVGVRRAVLRKLVRYPDTEAAVLPAVGLVLIDGSRHQVAFRRLRGRPADRSGAGLQGAATTWDGYR